MIPLASVSALTSSTIEKSGLSCEASIARPAPEAMVASSSARV